MMTWWSQVHGDIRQAWRMARHQPGFTLLVVITLALGIGVSTASFAALDRAVLRPLAFPDADRLAYITMEDATQRFRGTPPAAAVTRWRAVPVVTAIGGYRPTTAVYTATGVPEVLPAGQMTAELPALLRVRPVTGRMLGAADLDPAAPRAAMISESFWHQRFGRDPAVLQQSLTLGDLAYQIVGVWPSGAQVDPRDQADILFVAPDDVIRPSTLAYVIARLAPGVSHAVAERELRAHSTGIEGLREGMLPSVTSPTVFFSAEYVQGMWIAFGAAVLLLVVAIANTTNLLLSRAADRYREIGVRLAIGSSSSRLARQFFVEAAMLAIPGAVLAVGIAAAVSRLLAGLAEGTIPDSHFAGPGSTAWMFAAGGAAIAIAACGLAPVVLARRLDIRSVAGADSGARVTGQGLGFHRATVGLQSAVGLLLLMSAVIMGRSVSNLAQVDVGFDARELVTFSLSPPASRYITADARAAFLRTVHEQVASIPGVTGVTTSGNPLFRFSTTPAAVFLDGEGPPASMDGMEGSVALASAPADLFETFGLRLRAGRWFNADDGQMVVVVNESFARSRGGDVVGRRLFMYHPAAPPAARDRSLEIIGVVADVASSRPARVHAEDVQLWTRGGHGFSLGWARFVVRTSADPDATLGEIRTRIAALDGSLPVLQASTGHDLLRIDMAEHRFVAVVLASLGIVGLVLAIAGVYASVSLDVRRRTREVGVRVALGATVPQVVREVASRGLRPVAWGLATGVIAWFWLSQMLAALLFRVDALDPVSVVAGVGVLVVVALSACLLPASRAGRIDPAAALRS